MVTVYFIVLISLWAVGSFYGERKIKKAAALRGDDTETLRLALVHYKTGDVGMFIWAIFMLWAGLIGFMFLSFSHEPHSSYRITENDGTKLACQKVLTTVEFPMLWPGLTAERYSIPYEAQCVVISEDNTCEISDDGSAVCPADAGRSDNWFD